MVPTRGLHYSAVFRNIEALCSKIEEDLKQDGGNNKREPHELRFQSSVDEFGVAKYSIHGKKAIREYVDVL